jgi:hypothetical protein
MNNKDPELPSSLEDTQLGTSRILALIRLEDREAMSQLLALPHNLEICATADQFVEKCSRSQYEVAILPIGVLPPDDRMLLRSYLTSLELHPSIILYSSSSSPHWPGWLDAEDITLVLRPFTEAKFQGVISHAIEEFGERSRRLRC